MARGKLWILGLVAAVVVAALATPWSGAEAAAAPTVSAVFESRNAASGARAIVVTGKRLNKLTDVGLWTLDGNRVAARSEGDIVENLRTPTLLILTLPDDLTERPLYAEFLSRNGALRVDLVASSTSIRTAYTGSGNHIHISGNADDASVEFVGGGAPAASVFFNGFTNESQAVLEFQTKELAGQLATRMSIDPDGTVNVFGNLTKGSGTFRIDHPLDPENRTLSHSFVESPEMMNVYSGTATTGEDGRVVVELPSYFGALNSDPRYQLTVVGDFATAVVAERVRENRFTIRTDRPHVEVCWQVTGVRVDPFALHNPVRVEAVKPPSERGRYLHPEAWGQPADRGVGAGRGAAGAARAAASPR